MSERSATAYTIVNRYMKWAAGAGLIPVPLIDVAAVTGVQIKMLAEIGTLYDVPFRDERVKSIVGALIGAVTPPILGTGVLSILGPALKLMPGIGTLAGAIVTPAFNAASTYALGRVFVQHFESGGTFLDMDPDKVREHFQQEFQGASQKKETATVR